MRLSSHFRCIAMSIIIAVPCMLSPETISAATHDSTSVDTFDTLQDNVWYLPTEDKEADLYVTSLGNGPAVVVLHGGPGNDFNYLIDALRPLAGAYKFILFDQRGSLLSPVAEKDIATLSMDKLVTDLETLRKALGQDKLVIFGHSFGTLLAISYFKAHPDHVAGMVLAASVPPSVDNFGAYVKDLHKRENALQSRTIVQEAIRSAGLPADANMSLSPQQKASLFRIHNAALDTIHVERWAAFQGGGVYYNEKVDDAIGNSLADSYTIVPELGRYPIPVTVIQGDQDYIDPAASTWKPLQKSLPNVSIEVIPSASHYSWIDDPMLFGSDLTKALKRIIN